MASWTSSTISLTTNWFATTVAAWSTNNCGCFCRARSAEEASGALNWVSCTCKTVIARWTCQAISVWRGLCVVSRIVCSSRALHWVWRLSFAVVTWRADKLLFGAKGTVVACIAVLTIWVIAGTSLFIVPSCRTRRYLGSRSTILADETKGTKGVGRVLFILSRLANKAIVAFSTRVCVSFRVEAFRTLLGYLTSVRAITLVACRARIAFCLSEERVSIACTTFAWCLSLEVLVGWRLTNLWHVFFTTSWAIVANRADRTSNRSIKREIPIVTINELSDPISIPFRDGVTLHSCIEEFADSISSRWPLVGSTSDLFGTNAFETFLAHSACGLPTSWPSTGQAVVHLRFVSEGTLVSRWTNVTELGGTQWPGTCRAVLLYSTSVRTEASSGANFAICLTIRLLVVASNFTAVNLLN